MRLARFLFYAALTVLAIDFYRGAELPSPDAILPQLAMEPLQRPTDKKPFETTAGDGSYRIKPLYHYDLNGLIVSKHEANSFTDWVHKAWGDYLNVADICVVWGDNATSGIYRDISFGSGNFTCTYGTRSRDTWERFSQDQVSNNHLLIDRKLLGERLKKARVGDQIHFSGYLVEYSHDGGTRGTSVTRTDRGNGACETVYVEQFEVLRRAPTFWRNLRIAAIVALVASAVLWFVAPIQP
jgi:hypothetical protein